LDVKITLVLLSVEMIVNEHAYFFIRKTLYDISQFLKSALFFMEVLFEVLYFVVEVLRICLESPRLSFVQEDH